MRDANLQFSSLQDVSAGAFSTTAVEVDKTPEQGLWAEVVVRGAVTGTSPTMDVIAYGRAADSGWAVTDRKVGQSEQITAIGRYFLKIVTDLAFVKLYYDVGGTSPVFNDVDAHIVSGPEQDAVR